MMRASLESRRLNQLPLQSTPRELPTVPSMTESRSASSSISIGNVSPPIGELRNQLDGTDLPLSPPSSPCEVIVVWSPPGFDWWGPILPLRQIEGGPGLLPSGSSEFCALLKSN